MIELNNFYDLIANDGTVKIISWDTKAELFEGRVQDIPETLNGCAVHSFKRTDDGSLVFLISSQRSESNGVQVAGWNEESIVIAINAFVDKNNRFPKNADFTSENDLPCLAVIYKCTGGIRNIKMKYFPELAYERKNKWNKETAIKAIDEFVLKYRCLPLGKEFNNRYGLPTVTVAEKYLGMSIKEYFKKNYSVVKSEEGNLD